MLSSFTFLVLAVTRNPEEIEVAARAWCERETQEHLAVGEVFEKLARRAQTRRQALEVLGWVFEDLAEDCQN